jgi:hypothetical protein
MKNQLFAFTLSIAMLSCFDVKAENVPLISNNFKGSEEVLEKRAKTLSFYSATDTSAQTITGTEGAAFMPLSFTKYKHTHGDAIKSKNGGTKFHLDEGSYLILFTGSFKALGPSSITPFQLALKTGPDIIFNNADSIEASFDNIKLVTYSKIIKIEKHKNLSIVVQDTTASTSFQVTTRSISIIKLD